MDPLSLIANIIAVVGAARSVVRELERLRNLRRAPEKLLLLINEMSDFQTVLALFQETSEQLVGSNKDIAHQQHFQELIRRAGTTLAAINQSLAVVFGPDSTQSPVPEVKKKKFSWKAWLKIQGQVDGLFTNLGDLKRDVSNACTLLTVSQIPLLRSELHTMSVDSQMLNSRLQAVVAETTTTTLSTNFGTNMAHQTSSLLSRFTGNLGAKDSMVHTQTVLQRACNPLCICRCHHSIKIRSPMSLQSFIGLLFVGYSGTPLLPGQSCNQKLCERQRSSVLRLNYYFPAWLIHRMIVFRNKSTPQSGSMLSVRTPRIVSNASEIFYACKLGNKNEIHRLFAGGLASPFDTDMLGQTPLLAALFQRDTTVCKLLLDSYADPTQESCSSCSPLNIVWYNLLANPSDKYSQELRAVFASYLDVSDLQQKGFTAIHKTVLGLTSLSLCEQLQVSTTGIDSRCSMGLTPLMWAARRSDLNSVRTLLDFDADMEIPDYSGQTCVHYACKSPAKDSLILLSTLLKEAKNAETRAIQYKLVNPTHCIAHSPLVTAVIYKNIDCVRFLLDRQVDNEIEYSDAIRFAVEQNCHELLLLLLSRGSRRLRCTVIKARGFLHMAAIVGDLKTIQILASAQLSGVQKERKDADGNTPLQTFIHIRQHYRIETDTERDKCFSAFLKLLESIMPDLGEEVSPGSKVLLDLDELSCDSESDDEEFFDTLSDMVPLEEV